MKEIEAYIRKNGGYITARQAKALGRTTYYKVLDQVKEGTLTRVRQGVYALTEELANTMVDIRKIIPDGVLCLYSAWAYYRLTTQIPSEYYVAIERSRKIRVPDYPPITLCFWREEIYKLGVVNALIDGYDVPIYDIEKSVCDAIKYRNKIGIDVSSEILKTYLGRKNRDINKLIKYAKIMRVALTLKKYLEVQL
jgi:hypothetical protein